MQSACKPPGSRRNDTDGFNVSVSLSIIPANAMRGIAAQPRVQEAVTGKIMVDADHVRGARVMYNFCQSLLKAKTD